MRMMTVPECLEALEGRMTKEQLRYSIRMGYVKSLRIGGKVLVDLDTVLADLAQYRPQRTYPGGLVTHTALLEQTGLSRRQVDHGIREGWIVPEYVPGKRRPMYNLRHVQQYLHVHLTHDLDGKDGESGDD